MAALSCDPVTGIYHIHFRYGGRQFQKSLKTAETLKAESMKGQIEETLHDLERGRLTLPAGADFWVFVRSGGKLDKAPELAKSLTLGQLFTTYEEKLTEGAKEKNTRQTERIHAEHLKRVLGAGRSLESIRAGTLQEYIDHRAKTTWRGKRIQAQTIHKELDTLRAVWLWAKNKDHIGVAFPGGELTYPKQNEKPPFQTWSEIEQTIGRGGLSQDEVKALWNCLFLDTDQIAEVLAFVRDNTNTPWLYPLCLFAAHTGARRSEMLRARVEDFRFDDGTVILREKKKSKRGETFRRVPMTPLLKKVIKSYFAQGHPGGVDAFSRNGDEPLATGTAHDAFKWVLAESKWEVLRGYHIFRHSFASNLAAKNVDQREIDALMGHQTDEMRRRYRHLFPEQRKNAVMRVFG